MKKIRFVFPAIAFALAIGAAYASSVMPAQQGFIKVSDPLSPCSQSIQCNGSGATCLDGTIPVYDGTVMNATSCGNALQRNP